MLLINEKYFTVQAYYTLSFKMKLSRINLLEGTFHFVP